MSVRPPASMSVVSARRSVGIGVAEIFSMTLPRTRTCDGAESRSDFPSKMRTLEKTVTDPGGPCANDENAEHNVRAKRMILVFTVGSFSYRATTQQHCAWPLRGTIRR